MLVVGFVESTTLTNDSFRRDAALVPRVARAVRQLHQGPRFTGRFDMFERQAGYLTLVLERGLPHPADYQDHLRDFERIRQALSVHREPTRPCHNDSLAENFLDDGERMWIIDYEYSGNNEPSFELGNNVTECDLSPEQAEELTLTYYESDEFDDHERVLARAALQATVSRYGWSLWGYLQAATRPLDFDFTGWGEERYEKARADFASPHFESLLDRAARR